MRIFTLLLMAGVLAACGQKGALYLPAKSPAPATTPAPAPVPPAPAQP